MACKMGGGVLKSYSGSSRSVRSGLVGAKVSSLSSRGGVCALVAVVARAGDVLHLTGLQSSLTVVF